MTKMLKITNIICRLMVKINKINKEASSVCNVIVNGQCIFNECAACLRLCQIFCI